MALIKFAINLQEEFAGVVARVALRGRMGASQSTRQVDGLFESLLGEGFRASN